MATLRAAVAADVTGMQRVRRAVRENRLVSRVVADEDVLLAIERTGRGWVVEVDGSVVGFAIGHVESGNVWALFVDPDHEARGYGRRLHDAMLAWLTEHGPARLWLTTEPGTRAERFYGQAGWQDRGLLPNGERLFERYTR